MLILALGAVAGATVYLDSLIGQLATEISGEMRSVRASLAAINVAIDGMKQMLDANRETLRLHQGLLTRALAENRVSALLSTVETYLGQLEASGELEFEGAEDRANVTRKLKERIRPTILSEVLERPDLSDAQLRRRIERLADRYLDDF